VPERPDVKVRGEFKAEVGQKAEARLAAGLVDDPRVKPTGPTGHVFMSSAAASVNAFLPITLQGQLETGLAVTLVNANNHGRDGIFGAPDYKADYAVLGDRLVSGVDQLYSAMRFRFGDPYWLGHLRASDASVLDSDGSTLSVEISDDGNWLLYRPATPATQQRFENRVVLGCLSLAQLALDQDFTARDTHVRINDGDPWLTLHGPGSNTPPNEFTYHSLLRRDELTVERFAKWIPFHDTLDGLDSVASRPVEGFLQTQVLVLTALVEGLHRRMPETFKQSKFPDASGGALNRIKEAARHAARDKAADEEHLDPQRVRDVVFNAVCRCEDVDYVERATAVVAKVCAVIPEVAESVSDLPKLLTKTRNEMAHQVPQDHELEPLEFRHLRWLVVASVTPWLLRGMLLLEAGIDPSVLHRRHLADSSFHYFRANVAQFIKELGWQPPLSG
jgi:hypothetical protein